MRVLYLTFLVIYTFGAVSFAALLLLCLRQCWRRKPQGLDVVNMAMQFFCTVWFVLNLVVTIIDLSGRSPVWSLWAALMALAAVFPGLIAHAYYLEHQAYLSFRRAWRIWTGGIYALSGCVIAVAAMGGLGVLQINALPMLRFLAISLFVLFVLSFGFTMVWRQTLGKKRKESFQERRYQFWNLILLGLTVVMFGVVIASAFGAALYVMFIGLFSRALPLCFVFVGTYYQNRFQFFDVFVKTGTYFLVTLVLLTGFFGLVLPLLEGSDLGRIEPWLYAILLLPIALISPWGYRHLGAWLDRVWLGRSFTTVEGVKYFLAGTRGATREIDLVNRAQRHFSTIMQADARIVLDMSEAAVTSDPEAAVEVPIQAEGERLGVIRLGTRWTGAPYFSEDLALLGSLADVFVSILAGVRLQQKKQEQEKREQELILSANRSELKALRAQINPHFLFNALNAIAGLIQKNPVRAEETVERLAEVFRYTLRRSQNEWVRLAEEMDFVQSYLEIEQARFGDRLQVRMEVEEEAKELRIPAMIAQTLVENAVKHGVASVRGAGLVEVRARRRDGAVRIEVLDNGPGFTMEDTMEASNRKSGTGYGLSNIRQRLEGYFGAAGKLQVDRDESRGLTVVSVEMPAAATG